MFWEGILRIFQVCTGFFFFVATALLKVALHACGHRPQIMFYAPALPEPQHLAVVHNGEKTFLEAQASEPGYQDRAMELYVRIWTKEVVLSAHPRDTVECLKRQVVRLASAAAQQERKGKAEAGQRRAGGPAPSTDLSFALIYPQHGCLHPKQTVHEACLREGDRLFAMPHEHPAMIEGQHGRWRIDRATGWRVPVLPEEPTIEGQSSVVSNNAERMRTIQI